jgi:NAD(P)-dependent dehydrogenase (short-subunit alcohol dehydrogenase family)
VQEEEDWRRVIATVIGRHGQLDVLVNNAGITGFEDGLVPHDPEHATLSDWRAVHATNLDGAFLGCKHAIVAMRPLARARSSTFLLVRGWSAFPPPPPMRPPKRQSAITPRLLRSGARLRA